MKFTTRILPALTLVICFSSAISAQDTTGTKKKKEWYANPGFARYVMAPSGIPMKKNTGFYQTQYAMGHTVRYALTDNFNVSAGTEIASLLFRKTVPFYFYVNAQYSHSFSPLIHAGGGATYIVFPDDYITGGNAPSHYGAVYGLFTFGNANSNFSLGLGWNVSRISRGYYDSTATYVYMQEQGYSEMPFGALNGMLRLSNGFSLVMENWVIPQREIEYIPNSDPSLPPSMVWVTKASYVGAFGFRINGERVYFDAGLIISEQYRPFSALGLPYAMLTFNFGGKKKTEDAAESEE